MRTLEAPNVHSKYGINTEIYNKIELHKKKKKLQKNHELVRPHKPEKPHEHPVRINGASRLVQIFPLLIAYITQYSNTIHLEGFTGL